MAKGSFIFLCACLIIMQIVIVLAVDDDWSKGMDWTTIKNEVKKHTAPIRKKCIAKSGVDLETLANVELGKFPEDRKLGCYLKCVMETGGVLKKNQINYKLISKVTPSAYKSIATKMIDECRNVAALDSCDLAFKFSECMYNSNSEYFFIV